MTSKQKAQDCIGFLVDYQTQGPADSQQHEHSDTTLSCSTCSFCKDNNVQFS